MTKTICDRCGAETDGPSHWTLEYTETGGSSRHARPDRGAVYSIFLPVHLTADHVLECAKRDLCGACLLALKAWLMQPVQR